MRSLGVDVDDADRAAVAAAEREVGDVDAVPAEDRADFADDARLIVVGDDSIVPASGASTSRRCTDTSRGLFGSNTVPSTQRSPRSVCSLTETQAGVSARDRELRDSTMSMPRSRGDRARVHDRDAARQDRPQHAGGGAGAEHVDARGSRPSAP